MLLAVFQRDYELITLQNKLFAGKLCMHSRIITGLRWPPFKILRLLCEPNLSQHFNMYCY